MKKKKSNTKIFALISLSLVIVIIVVICFIASTGNKNPKKEYISPDDLSLQTKRNKESAIADEVKAYGEKYISNHKDICPNSLSDFLNKTDVLDSLELVKESDKKCGFIYKNIDGQKIRVEFNID